MGVLGSNAAWTSDDLEAGLLAVDVTRFPRARLPEEARSLIAELASSQRSLIERANELMLARDVADLLDRGADSAVDDAINRCDDEEALDHAVSSVRAASEARETEMRALERWVRHLDRVDDLVGLAARLTTRCS